MKTIVFRRLIGHEYFPTLLFFRVEVDSSDLLHRTQTHHPVATVVRNGRHVTADRLSICVSERRASFDRQDVKIGGTVSTLFFYEEVKLCHSVPALQ